MKETHLHRTIDLIGRTANDRVSSQDSIAQKVYNEINRYYPTNHSYRVTANVLTQSFFNRAIELIIIGQLPSAYVEIHSLIEVASIRFFTAKMKVKENEEVINKLIERKTLKDLIPLYLSLIHI